MSSHITPNSVYVQAYNDSIRDRVNLHSVKPEGWSWSYEVTDNHSLLSSMYANATLKMTFQGKYLRAKIAHHAKQKTTGHKRSIITDFSRGSRGRLFDLFNKLQIRQKVIFITLTYIEDTTDAETGKAQLFAFLKRLQRRFPKADMGFVWRLEFQERGAIHFHIIAFGLPFIWAEDMQKIWGEVTAQVRPFTRIEMPFSSKKITNYVSKYIAKVNPSQDSGFNLVTYLAAYQKNHGNKIGRVWGIVGKENLPYAELVELELLFNMSRFMRFRKLAEQFYPPMQDSISLGFRLYVPSAVSWLQWFHAIYDVRF